MTGDLSLRGMRLAIHSVEVLAQEIVKIEAAFEDAMVPFTGTVRHVSAIPWGCIAGVAFPEHALGYLAWRHLALSR